MSFSPKNTILSEIEPATILKLGNRLELLHLKRGTVLQEIGTPVEWVYFPDTALISVSSETVDGESVSGTLVGWRGAYGAFEACGSRQSFSNATIQISGDCWRIRAQHYRALFDESPGLRKAIHKHVESVLNESRQLVACAALHPVERRMCRVLLDASDRSHGGSELSLTQEALANILGVQRTTVAVSASALQREGLIRTGRGTIHLLDREGLGRNACSCRRTIQYADSVIFHSTDEVCEA